MVDVANYLLQIAHPMLQLIELLHKFVQFYINQVLNEFLLDLFDIFVLGLQLN